MFKNWKNFVPHYFLLLLTNQNLLQISFLSLLLHITYLYQWDSNPRPFNRESISKPSRQEFTLIYNKELMSLKFFLALNITLYPSQVILPNHWDLTSGFESWLLQKQQRINLWQNIKKYIQKQLFVQNTLTYQR